MRIYPYKDSQLREHHLTMNQRDFKLSKEMEMLEQELDEKLLQKKYTKKTEKLE